MCQHRPRCFRAYWNHCPRIGDYHWRCHRLSDLSLGCLQSGQSQVERGSAEFPRRTLFFAPESDRCFLGVGWRSYPLPWQQQQQQQQHGTWSHRHCWLIAHRTCFGREGFHEVSSCLLPNFETAREGPARHARSPQQQQQQQRCAGCYPQHPASTATVRRMDERVLVGGTSWRKIHRHCHRRRHQGSGHRCDDSMRRKDSPRCRVKRQEKLFDGPVCVGAA